MPMGVRKKTVGGLNCLMFFLFICSLLPSQYSAQVYDITLSRPLAQGQILVSPGQIFELGFFSPNHSANKYVGLWHKSIFPRKIVWVANRESHIAVTDTLASLRIGSNGNLELIDGKQNSVWSTNISASSNSSSAVLLDTGNFVLKDDRGADLWESFDHPCDTLLPSQLLGFDSKSGKQNFLTAWKSENDPSTGKYLVGLTPETPSQVVIWTNKSTLCWRSGPWDKSKFIGVPVMDDRYQSGFSLDDNVIEGSKYFSYNFYDYPISYIDISSEGIATLMLFETGKNWYLDWEAPYDPCDNYGVCGPFGVCKASESHICKCLKGFVPKSDVEWSKGNWTRGCVRQAKLFCDTDITNSVSSRAKQNNDGFWKMVRLKVPDSHELVLTSLDGENTPDYCKTRCLNNCSCLAYAFVNKIGCLVWSKDLIDIQEFSSGGETVYIRLAQSELGDGKPIKLISSLTAICSVSILVAIVFGWHRLRANRKGHNKSTTQNFGSTTMFQSSRDALRQYIGKHDLSELLIYDFDTILIATKNFSDINKLGQGGFGPVYKGMLEEGKEIAVKRLSSSSGQGIDEFKNEMLLISNLQHKNLVRIMGCCLNEEEKLLIYEFMPNKSLDTFLFDPTRRAVLDWARRFNIIQGVARGLLYLHHDSYLKVIHRDLKVSNILLDENMNPKISDFGLARIVEGTQNRENTQRVVGTRGYMSPEYAMGGIFSEKSDVYSFGVLVLEIISGKKNTSFCLYDQQLGFLAYAWNLWNEGRGLELVDEVLGDSYSSSEVMKCAYIGLLCVQDSAVDRPTMGDIVSMLSSDTDGPKPKEPVFTIQNSFSHPQPQYGNTYSTNEATITVIEGR
ncbi:G-type lectin S-receptor-like serine/threonine-protein kinase SD1-29 isoform X1 [Rosa rugosa]|uniref:G-type lectin S-receptor-like serine/threonine-protein kinase SD1-29 isoform X1 n=1 Tax=Rosa rugosa TaxID=74645 RepID=UPI002B416EF8|nr:G-type lectin S-receptor-like serine/threonine-protein kinase SD1-29 isoform X1 [Rosa rugosa]